MTSRLSGQQERGIAQSRQPRPPVRPTSNPDQIHADQGGAVIPAGATRRSGQVVSAFVQKLRVPVRVSQPNQDPRDGHLLLFTQMEGQDRPETVLELLNSRRSVIPFILAVDSTVLLLTRSNIDWVAIGAGADAKLVFPPDRAPTVEQRVELRFIDESRVDAVLQWCDQDGQTRLSDFLNSVGGFFAARTGFGTLIVNKFRVRETQVTEDTSRPIGA